MATIFNCRIIQKVWSSNNYHFCPGFQRFVIFHSHVCKISAIIKALSFIEELHRQIEPTYLPPLMVGPKKQDFWPRIDILKGKIFKKIGR